MKELWASTKRLFQFKMTVPIILLLVGILLEILGYTLWEEGDSGRRIFTSIGDLLLVSVLFSFLTSYVEYMGILKKKLTEIVYSSDYLLQRKDIEDIWERVSKIMFHSVFPKLHHCLFDIIKNAYLPKDGVVYYQDARCIHDIKYADDNKEIIVVTQEIEFEIIAINENEFPFTIWNSIKINEDKTCSLRILACQVNGQDMTSACEINQTDSMPNELNNTISIKLKSQKNYKFYQKIEKKYNIKYDNFIGYQAKWVVNNMRVQVFFPNDLHIDFIDRGTISEFKMVKRTENYLEYEYKGLILRKQGYLLILNKK